MNGEPTSDEALSVRDVGGCICSRLWTADEHPIDPECRYHQAAAEQPWNHRIPWNCPTYFDGCNCGGTTQGESQ